MIGMDPNQAYVPGCISGAGDPPTCGKCEDREADCGCACCQHSDAYCQRCCSEHGACESSSCPSCRSAAA